MTLVFELKTSEERDLPVFVAGNFNNWNATDQRYQLSKVDENRFQITLENGSDWPEIIEYKYHRGGWDTVELDANGNEVPNRRISASSSLISDEVPNWRGIADVYRPEFLPIIKTLSEQFEIPQLVKTRRISALLPHDYETSDKHYPVLYLQDGQNLFDENAPYGNWGLDKKMAMLSEKKLGDLIIITIDHAEEERILEFTPSEPTRLGVGDGKKYVRFLVDTLKPYVDQNFRTKPERAFTGLGGSSMGGLISVYAGLIAPATYSKLMIFSPSLWVVPNMRFHTMNFHHTWDTKIYLYGGKGEGSGMVPSLKRLKSTIEQQGSTANIDFNLSIDPDGKHNESRWGEEFPKAVEWLFYS